MARTIRTYHDGMCLRTQSNHPHKKEQSILKDIVTDDSFDFDFNINLGNRALLKAVPEPYEDKAIAALYETKSIWKHDKLPQTRFRFRA